MAAQEAPQDGLVGSQKEAANPGKDGVRSEGEVCRPHREGAARGEGVRTEVAELVQASVGPQGRGG